MSLWTNLIDDWGEESVVLWNISDYNDLSSLSIEMWRSLYSTYYYHTLHTAPCSSLVSSGPGSSLGSHQPLEPGRHSLQPAVQPPRHGLDLVGPGPGGDDHLPLPGVPGLP